jgi:hypothetical protein
MSKLATFLVGIVTLGVVFSGTVYAQTTSPAEEVPEATAAAEVEEISPTPTPRPDITQKTEETVEPLVELLNEQELGSVWPANPLKYAIRAAIGTGVPANTIVLLILLTVVATVIAASRHLIGLRGFGIFLPTALSVVFVAIGPVVGIGLFLVIVITTTLVRMILRKTKIKLQYLPRMALLMSFAVVGVLGTLFMAPVIQRSDFANVSIFPVLLLVLLAEDFSRVQLGKSAKTAVNITTETLILALGSYILLTLEPVREFALLNPEATLLSVLVFNFFMGKYVGLRLVEIWRFRKLITG